ncbi:hypothetical protein [Pedobacter punctiformis]|uniref:Peptidase S24/S26A/S26B/S26C domain-containing protein n=1 Tax=Pedobacter punctiformis TaxID=3004097 RepID=A0ABT4LAG7_9SPHI|nr:hypothetical protein [Pedobacter sp. HCMS5-2]MCZ4244921.1 hypothetical protein [Pedobacter sp. HCMS5-2]
MTDLQIIKIAVGKLKSTGFGNQKEIGKLLGYSNESSFSQVLNGKVPLPTDLITKIMSLNDDIKNFILNNKEESVTERKPKLEAKPLRLADPLGFEATSDRFYSLPDDSLIMQTPVIPYKAWGSYLRGHSDPEFYADLDTIPLPVDKKHFGSYLIFEMGGESMINITSQEMARKSLWPGQKIVGRDLSRDKWKYKLHINTTEAWVIVHRTEGIVVKSIIDHDVDSAQITLHSWNPDKENYPDFTVSLNDVEQIFNIVDPYNKFG